MASVYDQIKQRLQEVDQAMATGELDREETLEEWWMRKSAEEIDGMLAKTSEYGAGHRDPGLVSVGQDFATTMGRGKVSDQEAAEIAIWFYIRGKVARAYSALADGRMPSDDTILDIGVYNRMLQRVRETGGWPN